MRMKSSGTRVRRGRRLRGWRGHVAGLTVVALTLAACGDAADDEADPEDVAADVGVDLDEQVVRIGALNDESGPAAGIGVPYALGKRLLVEQVNAGELDVLPEGWTVELVERDHEYNPQESVQAFNEIAEEVLYFATSFGTPNTLPLVDPATEQEITLFPASLSSELAQNEYTPPIGAPYKVEAHQAVDWAVEDAGDDLRFAIIHQLDDYGEDGLAGVREAAEHHDIEIVAEIGIAPGETDVTGPITELSEADATHVLLTTLPTSTGPILGTAAQLEYFPTWLGNTPAWIDRFFDEETLPSATYQDFVWVTGLTLWGEDLPGMGAFIEAYEEYAAEDHPPDFYLIASYAQGLLSLEAFSRALDNGDVTRAGYHEALRSIQDYDADGLFPQPVDLDTFPYEPVTDTRVLRPGEDLTDWNVVREFSTPESWAGL